MTANITLLLVSENNTNPQNISNEFETALYAAIVQGRLQSELVLANPQTPALILTSALAPTAAPTVASGKIVMGATAGIVIGSVFVVTMLFGSVLYLIQGRSQEQDYKTELEPHEKTQDEEADISPKSTPVKTEDEQRLKEADAVSESDSDIYMDGDSRAAGRQLLGAEKADYGRPSRLDMMQVGDDIVAEPALREDDDEPEMDTAPDSSSNAGSSGWSSSAGISSLNTGSLDDSMDAALAAATATKTLATVGAASGIARRLPEDDDEEDDDNDEDDEDDDDDDTKDSEMYVHLFAVTHVSEPIPIG